LDGLLCCYFTRVSPVVWDFYASCYTFHLHEVSQRRGGGGGGGGGRNAPPPAAATILCYVLFFLLISGLVVAEDRT